MARLEKIVDDLYERSDREVFRILNAMAALAMQRDFKIETGEPRSISPESEFPSSQKEVHIGHTDPGSRPAPL